MIGEIMGATLIVLLLSLVLRKLLVKVTNLSWRVSTTLGVTGSVVFCILGALPNRGQAALVIYPAGGVVTWVWLLFNRPIGMRFFGSVSGVFIGIGLGILYGLAVNDIGIAAFIFGCIGLILGFCFLEICRRVLSHATCRCS